MHTPRCDRRSRWRRCPLIGTEVTDVKPLAGLTALRELYLVDTPVSDISSLSELELDAFNVAYSKVSDAQWKKVHPSGCHAGACAAKRAWRRSFMGSFR